MNTSKPSEIEEQLRNLKGLDNLRSFFQLLGYQYADQPISTRGFKEDLVSTILPDSLRVIAHYDQFPILYAEARTNDKSPIERQLAKTERLLLKKVPDKYSQCLLVIYEPKLKLWHFVNSKSVGKKLRLRRFVVGEHEKLRTAAERLSLIKTEPGDDWAKLLNKHEEAFDREKVSDAFFAEYRKIFLQWKKEFARQIKDEHGAHNFLQQFLNRLMFIYFLQRKGWLGSNGNSEFIKQMWLIYRNGNYPKNSFYKKWLEPLFFSALNNKKDYKNKGLPPEIEKAFDNAPFLNGGLFKPHEGIDDLDIKVADDVFAEIFESLLDRYNFTVTEDTPFDQNVSVDPEMLGIVYEQLVNVTETEDEQASSGIFYTPRIEVDFMCRRSLLEYIARHAEIQKEPLYYLIFGDEDEAKQSIPKNSLQTLREALRNVTVVDPACGSGAFLVGMMQVILDIERRLAEIDGKVIDEFNEKKRIIERSLYGVDVKDWAIGVAQLRLWLSLIVDADEKRLDLEGMKIAGEALLPSLSFKIREGDSLVQEIAGKPLPIRGHAIELDQTIKSKITELRKLKADFFFNRGEITEEELRRKEKAIYIDILKNDIKKLQNEYINLSKSPRIGEQQPMFKSDSGEPVPLSFVKQEEERIAKRRQEIEQQIEDLKKQQADIINAKHLFWGIEFAEIFTENDGFDIVIGNPPYVRQEKIANPRQDNPDVEQRREYKGKLQKAIRLDWPEPPVNIGAKADLYVYFYLRGLALLNPHGTFCFITSNSWLDVEYGKGLQEFIVTRTPIYAIYDNQAKRTFKRADINTVIVLLGAPRENHGTLEHTAKFVMFKKPFEEAISLSPLLELEKADSILANDIFRVFPISQRKLWQEGLQLDGVENDTAKLQNEWTAPYIGNKWGGKYLRAPDIYWRILEKGKGKLVRLGDIAEVRFGIKTGCNEFFYFPNKDFDIDIAKGLATVLSKKGDLRQFYVPLNMLKPTLFSLKEIENILSVSAKSRKLLLSIPPLPKNKLPQEIRNYIEFGEAKGYHLKPTCSSRNPWYSIANNWQPTPLIFPSKIGERFLVFMNEDKYLEDKKLYGITPKSYTASPYQWAVALNSSIVRLFIELSGRQLTGAQAIADIDVAVVKGLLIPNPALLNDSICKAIIVSYDQKVESCFKEYGINKSISIREQRFSIKESRANLDNIVFKMLGLDLNNLIEAYQAIAEIVKARLDKAQSV